MKRTYWGFIFGIIFLFLSGAIQAQEKYPDRPIELVVPMGPGGASDLSARVYTEELSRVLKVPVNVINRAGGSGVQGTTYVTKAKKDGYTLLHASSSHTIIMPLINEEATYNVLRDLLPLSSVSSVASLIAVRSDSPFKTLEELIEYARKTPGKLKSAQGGLGTESYFNQEILCSKTNIKVTSIPFKSGAESVTALLGGHVDMAANTLPALGPHLKAGKLRGLAITSKKRVTDFPDIPTTTELGHPYANFCAWHGVFAPAGIPQNVQNVLVSALDKALNNSEVIQRTIKAGFIVDYLGPEEFRKYIGSQLPVYDQIAHDANLAKK